MQTQSHDRVQQLADEALAKLSQELAAGKSETLKVYLAALAKFHRYSFGNQLLIAFQRPDATFVAGFTTWKTKFHRFVRKGEKGIMIMAPITRRVATGERTAALPASEEPTESCLIGVKAAYVFDVSQTEGDSLPDFASVSGDPAQHSAKLKALVQGKGIALEYAESLGGALGVSSGNKITLLSGQAPAAEFSTLVHELAHELLHRDDRRTQTSKTVRETEAEAVAYAVCQAIGLETSSQASDYIQLYRGDAETLSESLHFIRNVASEIIAALTEGSES